MIDLAPALMVIATAVLVVSVIVASLPAIGGAVLDLWDRLLYRVERRDPREEDEDRFLGEWWGDQTPTRPGESEPGSRSVLTSDIERGKSASIG